MNFPCNAPEAAMLSVALDEYLYILRSPRCNLPAADISRAESIAKPLRRHNVPELRAGDIPLLEAALRNMREQLEDVLDVLPAAEREHALEDLRVCAQLLRKLRHFPEQNGL